MADVPSDLFTGLPVFLIPSCSASDLHTSATSSTDLDTPGQPLESVPREQRQQQNANEEEEEDPIPLLIRRSLASLRPLTPRNPAPAPASTRGQEVELAPESELQTTEETTTALMSMARFAAPIARVTDQISAARIGLEGLISSVSRGSEIYRTRTVENRYDNNLRDSDDGVFWRQRWFGDTRMEQKRRPRVVTRKLSEEAVAGVDATEDWIEIFTDGRD